MTKVQITILTESAPTFEAIRKELKKLKIPNVLQNEILSAEVYIEPNVDIDSVPKETITEPQFQYTRDDFESQEEFNKYKEKVYMAKIGAKITTTDRTILGKD